MTLFIAWSLEIGTCCFLFQSIWDEGVACPVETNDRHIYLSSSNSGFGKGF